MSLASVPTNDITPLRQAEAARARERNLLRMMFDLLPDYIYLKDTQSRFVLCNNRRADDNATAAKADELIGKTDADYYPPEQAAQFRADELKVLAGTPLLDQEEVLTRPDGSQQIILTTKLPFRDETGKITGVLGYGRDITARKRAEQELLRLNAGLERHVAERTAQLETANTELQRSRAVLENLFVSLPGLFLVLTPELRIVAVSDAYLKATMTTREGIVGRGLFEVFPGNPGDPKADGVRNLHASLERVRQSLTPDTMAIQQYDVRRPDGVFEERHWSPINSPVLGADRRLEYIIHRVEDVTDFVLKRPARREGDAGLRVRLQQMEAESFKSAQAVQAANQQLRALNSELEAFSYSVSHDLRAPLRHIDGFAQLLQKRADAKLDDQSRRYVATIVASARRLGLLIDDLLAFSRMGRAELRQTRVETRPLVDEIVRELEHETRGRHVEWQIGALPAVSADIALLRQVWANLLGNAVKYTRGREPARIEVFAQSNGDAEHVFGVRDNGAGFDMKYAAKLFGVFQRLHSESEFEGTGIGLANVRRIISRHGGRTWAEGRVGEGATFFFSLPSSTDPSPP